MNKTHNIENTGPDMNSFDIARTGSEVNELEVPLNELVKDYPGIDVDEEKNHGE